MAEKIYPYLGKKFAQNNINKAEFVILPIPFEKEPSYGKGAKLGPSAILKASCFVEEYDEELQQELYRYGIYTHKQINCNKDAKTVLNLISETIDKLLKQKKFIITLGGEHSITPAVIKSYLKHFEDFTVLSLDAHADLRDEYLKNPLSHACAMRRTFELVNSSLGKSVVTVGVRSFSKNEHLFYKNNKDNIVIYSADKIHRNKNWAQEVAGFCKKHIYMSIDADVFDPAFMPSVGTPEPGGLNWNQIIDLLRALKNSNKKIIGADIVELAPIKGLIHPDFLCAKLIYKIIGLQGKASDARLQTSDF